MEYQINKLLCVIISAICLTMAVNAQEILLEEEPKPVDSINTIGANGKNYFHVFIRANFFITNSNIDIIPFKSNEATIGLRYKRKIFEFLALGSDAALTQSLFKIDQTNTKIFPTPDLHDAERIVVTSLGLSPYLRFNIGKRGNFLGKFIDVSFYFNYFAGTKNEFKDKTYDNNYKSQVTQVKHKNLDYMSDYEYGIMLRAGYNKVSLFYKQRLTNLIDNSSYPGIDDLPYQSAGIELKL